MANTNQNTQSYNFITPIKLDQNNFMVWRNQVLASIKGNGLEGFITGANQCPDQYCNQINEASSSTNAGSNSRTENPAFATWIRTDQLLLSWMFSSIQENLLTSVIHCVSSKELWDSLTRMFVSQTQARIMPLKMQLQTAKKGSMPMTAYFSKMKRLADSLAIVGKPVEHNDLITYILTGLDSQDYESLVTTLLAKGENMSLDELYAVLLSHEMRLDQKKGKLSDDVMHNLTANVAQKNQGFYKGNFGYQRGIGGFGGNTQNNFGNGSNGGNNMPFKPNIVCQICFIPGHGATKCKNMYNSAFVP